MPATSAVFVSNNFPSSHEQAVGSYNLNQLVALRARGAEFDVLATRPWFPLVRSRHAVRSDPDGTIVHGMRVGYPRVLYLPLTRGGQNGWLYAASVRSPLRRRCRAFAPRFLWSSFVFPDGVGVGRVAAELRLPHVVTVVGSDLNLNLEHPARLAAIKRCAAAAVLVLAKSRALEQALVAQGVDPGKIVVDYNGVDTGTFRPRTRAEACARLGESPLPRRLLFVGSLVPVKNVPVLLRAFGRLRERWTAGPVELVVVGDGFLRQSLSEEALRLGVSGQVRFMGARAHAETALWLGASDLLCLPSLAEGVPNVVLEALASGRPVVASAVGGIPEVHPGAEAGALVRSNDEEALAAALQETLSHPRDPERLAGLVSGHTWDANAVRILERLAGLGLAGSPSGA